MNGKLFRAADCVDLFNNHLIITLHPNGRYSTKIIRSATDYGLSVLVA